MPTPAGLPRPPRGRYAVGAEVMPGVVPLVWLGEGGPPLVLTTIAAARLPLLSQALIAYLHGTPPADPAGP